MATTKYSSMSRLGTRYLGSKARVLRPLLELIGRPRTQDARFIDGFAGTGIVSQAAANVGWRVTANDTLTSATVLATARLTSAASTPFAALGGYSSAQAVLNGTPGVPGFLTREYSPFPSGAQRMYFTVENAMKIDAIRLKIGEWRTAGLISDLEQNLLIADLIEAANSVANTAGTYGCYLSSWTSSSQQNLYLARRALRANPVEFTVLNSDVFTIRSAVVDTVYLDPPYTKRQYAAYYHILETIALYDEPAVSGVTGLRPWKDKASVFCYKRKALSNILRLIEQQKANRILLSYNSEGHVALNELVDKLAEIRNVTLHELGAVGRYASNGSNATGSPTEYLIEMLPVGTRVTTMAASQDRLLSLV